MSDFERRDAQVTARPYEAIGEPTERAAFITRTYAHLLGAVVAFVAIEWVLFSTGVAWTMARAMLSTSWLLVLGGFVLVSWIASAVAHRVTSPVAQYAALAGFVVAEAIIFVPLLAIAFSRVPGAVQSAATVTALGFLALTAVAFMSRKDFSFLGASLRWVGLMALVAIVAAVIFGFELGTWFSVGMIALAGVAILYDTSNVIHHYPTDRHVAASLQLFASVALMLWYVLRLFMSRD